MCAIYIMNVIMANFNLQIVWNGFPQLILTLDMCGILCWTKVLEQPEILNRLQVPKPFHLETQVVKSISILLKWLFHNLQCTTWTINAWKPWPDFIFPQKFLQAHWASWSVSQPPPYVLCKAHFLQVSFSDLKFTIEILQEFHWN